MQLSAPRWLPPPPTLPVLLSAGLHPHDGVQAWHHWAQRAGPCSGMPGAETQEQIWEAATSSPTFRSLVNYPAGTGIAHPRNPQDEPSADLQSASPDNAGSERPSLGQNGYELQADLCCLSRNGTSSQATLGNMSSDWKEPELPASGKSHKQTP